VAAGTLGRLVAPSEERVGAAAASTSDTAAVASDGVGSDAGADGAVGTVSALELSEGESEPVEGALTAESTAALIAPSRLM